MKYGFILGTYDGRTEEYRRKIAIEDIWNRISKLPAKGNMAGAIMYLGLFILL